MRGVGGPASISPPHKASSDVGLCTCRSFCLHTLLSPLHPPTSYATSRSGLESSLHQQSFARPPRLDEEPYNILQLFPSFPFTVLSQLVPECLHFCLIKSVSRSWCKLHHWRQQPALFISGRPAHNREPGTSITSVWMFEWKTVMTSSFYRWRKRPQTKKLFSRSQLLSESADAWTQESSELVPTTPVLPGRTAFLPSLGKIILSLGIPAWGECPRRLQAWFPVEAEAPGGCHLWDTHSPSQQDSSSGWPGPPHFGSLSIPRGRSLNALQLLPLSQEPGE